MRYFLAPCSGEKSHKNYLSTLGQGVPYDRIEPFLNPEGKAILSGIQTIYAWANREGKRVVWERMKPGDTVIFYKKGNFVMSAEVIYKQADDGLARAMWPLDDKGKPWKYTFFLKDQKHFKVPLKIFNMVSGYRMKALMGFMELSGAHLELLQKQSTVEDFFTSLAGESVFQVPKENSLHINLSKEIDPIFRNIELVPFRQRDGIKRSKRKGFVDFDEVHKRNSEIGSKGEAVVLKYEIDRLRLLGKNDLAGKVRRLSLEDTYGGYDILSYDADGTERNIEVKTTTNQSASGISFYISPNEIKTAESTLNYYIYIVCDVDSSNPKILALKNPFSSGLLKLEPVQFRAQADFN